MEEAIAMVLSILVVFMAAERNGLISVNLEPSINAMSAAGPGLMCDQMSFYCMYVDENGQQATLAAAVGP